MFLGRQKSKTPSFKHAATRSAASSGPKLLKPPRSRWQFDYDPYAGFKSWGIDLDLPAALTTQTCSGRCQPPLRRCWWQQTDVPEKPSSPKQQATIPQSSHYWDKGAQIKGYTGFSGTVCFFQKGSLNSRRHGAAGGAGVLRPSFSVFGKDFWGFL